MTLPDDDRPRLTLADNLEIPVDAVTQTFAILAKRGVGKTYTGSVLVEELLGAGQQVVVIDPLDVWWGLRAAADGEEAGLPIAVMGGTQGDVPLEADQGRLVADLVVEQRVPAVLSLRHLSKTAQKRFVADFAERLYERKGEAGNRSPLHLVIDEADAYVPQRVMADTARVMGAVDDLVRRGRASGIGVTLITQRASVIHKDVLTQIEVLVALRTVSPQDRKAIEGWIDAHDPGDRMGEVMGSLASLAIGEAWVWSPGWLDVLERVRIRRRRTFDSSSTPEVGGQPVVPAGRASIDLAAIREALMPPEPPPAEKRGWSRRRGARVAEPAEDAPEIDPAVAERLAALEERVASMEAALAELRGGVTVPATTDDVSLRPRTETPAPEPLVTLDRTAAGGMRTGQLRILSTLARFHPAALTRPQIGAFAKLSHDGGTFASYVSALQDRGLILRRSDSTLVITAAGLELLGAERPPRPESAAEVVELWRDRLPAGTVRILETVADQPAKVWTRGELAAAVGLTATGGTFAGALGMLRRLDLVAVRVNAVTAGPALTVAAREVA